MNRLLPLSCLSACQTPTLNETFSCTTPQAWRGIINDYKMLYTDPAFEHPLEALHAYPGACPRHFTRGVDSIEAHVCVVD